MINHKTSVPSWVILLPSLYFTVFDTSNMSLQQSYRTILNTPLLNTMLQEITGMNPAVAESWFRRRTNHLQHQYTDMYQTWLNRMILNLPGSLQYSGVIHTVSIVDHEFINILTHSRCLKFQMQTVTPGMNT